MELNRPNDCSSIWPPLDVDHTTAASGIAIYSEQHKGKQSKRIFNMFSVKRAYYFITNSLLIKSKMKQVNCYLQLNQLRSEVHQTGTEL